MPACLPTLWHCIPVSESRPVLWVSSPRADKPIARQMGYQPRGSAQKHSSSCSPCGQTGWPLPAQGTPGALCRSSCLLQQLPSRPGRECDEAPLQEADYTQPGVLQSIQSEVLSGLVTTEKCTGTLKRDYSLEEFSSVPVQSHAVTTGNFLHGINRTL